MDIEEKTGVMPVFSAISLFLNYYKNLEWMNACASVIKEDILVFD